MSRRRKYSPYTTGQTTFSKKPSLACAMSASAVCLGSAAQRCDTNEPIFSTGVERKKYGAVSCAIFRRDEAARLVIEQQAERNGPRDLLEQLLTVFSLPQLAEV